MSSISVVQSKTNITTTSETGPNQSVAEATTSTTSSSKVYISLEAWQASNYDQNVTGIKAPDYMTQWFNKDFSQDIMDGAKARLTDIKANGSLGSGGPMNLPLLPENQKLMDSFQEEMNSISSAGLKNATPAQSERFNTLTNLSLHLQLVGGIKSMNEADVQREFDVSMAMAKLSIADSSLLPSSNTNTFTQETLPDKSAGTTLKPWLDRWKKEGLTMPEQVNLSTNHSMWVDVANAAGIGQDEFLSKARELSTNLKGRDLTKAIESFISDRYISLTEIKNTLPT